MKNLKEKRLLSQIVFHNVQIILIVVILVWVYITASLCQSSYQSIAKKHQEILHQFADDAREEINRAAIHTGHIAQSSFISNGLQKESFTVVEMLEFFDHATEILALPAEESNGILIYHTNQALPESRFFLYSHRLPEYETILQKFQETGAGILFDKTVTKENRAKITYILTMYRRVPWNSDNILIYPVTLPVDDDSAPISVIHSQTSVEHPDDYYSEKINEDFRCIYPIPKAELHQKVMQVFLLCSSLLAMLILILIALSKRTAKQTLREINDFIETLQDDSLLQEDKLFQTTYDLYELNIIQKTLQTLVSNTKEYTLRLQSAELENKQLELERLAMQLDPHMLYNSLASIRLDAYLDKNKKILNLVDSMALYYRSVLKKDQKLVFLANELETIEKYLHINELSQNKQFPLEVIVDESLKKLLIPPQFLHTFVENAVVHGLSGAKQNCVLQIKVSESEGIITIEIYDNGYGITPEKLASLNEDTQPKEHIGIRNSLRRLKLVYGEESSIRFESEKDVFTRVIIRFPKLPEEA